MDRKRKRCSNSDDEDDVPLKLIKINSNYEDPNSYDSLCMPNNQECELCYKVSKNRYTSYIHNVKHIIIPLINQTVYQCEICLYHFTSQSDLNRHSSRKHSSKLVSRISNDLEDELRQTDLGAMNMHLVTISSIKEENVCHENNYLPKSSLKEDRTDTSHFNTCSIKNRLLFEEDIVPANCDRLLTDLTTDCQVKVEWFPPIWQREYPKSVHYDELIKPGVFRCKKCVRTFPTRFSALTHEARHIFFKNSQVTFCNLCNEYILGDMNRLKQHQLTSHAQHSPPRDRERLKKFFGGKSEENNVKEPYVTKIRQLKFCDICFSFCKNNSAHSYDCVGELSEMGKRYRCQKCGYKFFVVKLVNLETRYKYSSFANRKHKKGVTNEDRLKIIAQRIKRMNKTYLCVFNLYSLPGIFFLMS